MVTTTAIPTSQRARAVGIKTIFDSSRGGNILNLPQSVIVLGQGSSNGTYSTDKAQVTNSVEVGQKYGFGSPLHLAVAQLLPQNGDGVGSIPVTVLPLEDDTNGVASVGTITPTGTQTKAGAYTVVINGKLSNQFVISTTDTVANICTNIAEVINANLNMPVIATATATEVTLTAKWKGESGNAITATIEGDFTLGTTFAVVNPTGGLVNPQVTDALAKLGNTWYTAIVNCFDYTDDVTLDALATVAEGRWGSTVRTPYVAVAGSNVSDLSTMTALTSARPTDRTNVVIPAPDCADLPLEIASRAVCEIVIIANDNPPRDYGSIPLNTLTAGADELQWDDIQRDVAVKAGCSTTQVKDGLINLSDTITSFAPEGELDPGYRYVCDLMKVFNIIYNVDILFNNPEWDGAPLIPDNQPTVNPTAKQPKMAVATLRVLADNLGLGAIISDPDYTKDNTQAGINSQNAKRLDIIFPVKLSGNTNIISIDLFFGFYYGDA